jgi:hypothetical protein
LQKHKKRCASSSRRYHLWLEWNALKLIVAGDYNLHTYCVCYVTDIITSWIHHHKIWNNVRTQCMPYSYFWTKQMSIHMKLVAAN